MKSYLLLFCAFVSVFSLFGKEPAQVYKVPDIPLMNEWGNVDFVHVDFDARDLKVGDKIDAGDLIGHISKYPDTLSLWFGKELDQSMAYYEISRSQASIQDMKGTTAYSQGLQYLTECAYEMRQDELANYLAIRTLIYDPKNEYAKFVKKATKRAARQ